MSNLKLIGRRSTKLLIVLVLIGLCFMLIRSQQHDVYAKYRGKHLILTSESKDLFWFHGIHCNIPEHRMFSDIKQSFADFAPDLVLVEGGADASNYQTEREAILCGGEPSYVAYLAKKSKIELQNIEPSDREVFTYLLEKYSQRDVLAMYLLRQINQKQREAEQVKLNFNDYFIRFIENMGRNGFPLEQAKVDAVYIATVLTPYVGYEVNAENWLEIDAKHLVYKDSGIIHQIWQDTINFRDQHCVDLIAERLKTSDRIFIMMGFDHAKNQEMRLRDIFATYQ